MRTEFWYTIGVIAPGLRAGRDHGRFVALKVRRLGWGLFPRRNADLARR